MNQKSNVDNATLKFIYGNIFTKTLMTAVLKRGILKCVTKYCDSPFSKIHIKSFARKRNIEIKKNYISFNSFFTRGTDSITFKENTDILCSPCEATLTIFNNSEDFFQIKNETHNIKSLLGGDDLGFDDPLMLMFHLSTAHCHRAYAFDSGKITLEKEVIGAYNATNPAVSLNGKNPLCTNYRVIHIYESDNFGKVAIVQVGSMLVSSINRYVRLNESILRGDAYGSFKLGGSAIVVLINKKNVDFSNATLNKELSVNIGDNLGIRRT